MLMRERVLLKMIDEMIINATPEELKEIQKIDRQGQLDGLSFCDIWANHKGRRERLPEGSKSTA